MAPGMSRRGNSFPTRSRRSLRFSASWPTLPYITILYYYTFPFSLIFEFAGGANVNNKLSDGEPAGPQLTRFFDEHPAVPPMP